METEDKKITPKLEEKLRAYKGFTEDSTFLYVPLIYRENDVPKDQWPVFKLKGRSGLDIAHHEDELGYDIKGNKTFTNSGEVRIKILREHILGWKNFFDRENNEINFMTGKDGVSKKLIAKMPNVLQLELLEAVTEHSRLTEEELTGLES